MIKLCVICGRPFECRTSDVACAGRCAIEHKRTVAISWKRQWRLANRSPRNCVICGEKFYPGYGRSATAKTCKDECSKILRSLWDKRPERILYFKKYRRRPEVMKAQNERAKKRYHSAAGKEKILEYQNRPEIKAHRRNLSRIYANPGFPRAGIQHFFQLLELTNTLKKGLQT